MDHPAVKLWRDKFRLNLSASWKRDVEITVKDLKLWKSILDGWYWIDTKGKKQKKAPGIKNLLTEYERLSVNREVQPKVQSVRPAESVRPARPVVLPSMFAGKGGRHG